MKHRKKKEIYLKLEVNFFSPKIRQRIDSSKLEYFLSWMLHSEFLINIPWGSTTLKLDSGQSVEIPKQLLQAQESQILFSYKQHCQYVGIDGLSDRTLYSILNSLHLSHQKSTSGIDEFAKSVSEAWTTLEDIIRQLPITYTTKMFLIDSIEKNKMYLKTKYGCQCEEISKAATHCQVFALSQSDSSFYSQICNHDHPFQCTCTGINDK